MEKNEYLKSAHNALIRTATVLTSRIGDVYNNEPLIMQNEDIRASYSVRLNQARGYDAGEAMMMYAGKESGLVPLSLKLSEIYTDIDYAYKTSERRKIVKTFIKDDATLNDEGKRALLDLLRDGKAELKNEFKESLIGPYERCAKMYQKVIKSNIDYMYLDIVARLDLYVSLLDLEEKYTAVNFEEAMLIRREEYFESVNEEGHERFTLFLSECLLDATTRGADDLDDLKDKGVFAHHFLSMKMEKGKSYSLEELALLFNLSTEMLKALIIIPALSSDQVSVSYDKKGDPTISLIS